MADLISMRNEVIVKISKSDLINSAIRRICPPKWRDDFQAHFYLQLFEMKAEKLIKADTEGWIDWLCVSILSNQMNSNTSSFWKIYRNGGTAGEKKIWTESELWKDEGDGRALDLELNRHQPDTSEGDIELKIEWEARMLKVVNALNSRHYYHRHLYLMHLNGMSYRKIERETGISYQSVRLSILATTEWLKKNINDYDN